MSLYDKQLANKNLSNNVGQLKVGGVSSIFGSTLDDEIDESELDPKLKSTLEQAAQNVVRFGTKFEEDVKNKNKLNPNYWFLYDTDSLAYKYYRRLIQKALASDSSAYRASSENQPDGKVPNRKRKSRWGDKVDDTVLVPQAAVLATNVASDTTATASSSQPADEDEFKKQILASQLLAKALAKATKAGPSYEYDSDEDTEGGTFEHKRRLVEMQKTYDKAKELTEKSTGKHHLADFLPEDEKQQFFLALTKAKQLAAAGNSASSSSATVAPKKEDYVENKLQADNVGFKLLQKMGWSSGKGLGASEQGIQAPVNKGKAPNDTQGLGADSSAEKDDDSLFDMYRKRMMQAYKFRPNPLNNPRRPYY